MKFNPNKLTNLAFLAVSEDNFNSIYELLVANDTNNLYLLHWCNYNEIMRSNVAHVEKVENLLVNSDKNIFCFFEITKEVLIDLVNQKISYLDVYKSSRAFFVFNEPNPNAGNWFRINTIEKELLPKEGDMFDVKHCRDLERLNLFINKTSETSKIDKTSETVKSVESVESVESVKSEVIPEISIDSTELETIPMEMELETISLELETIPTETELEKSKTIELEKTASNLFAQNSEQKNTEDSEPKKYNFKTNPNFRNNKK